MANEITPKSKILPDCLKAFLVGGIICDIGQLIHNIYIDLLTTGGIMELIYIGFIYIIRVYFIYIAY